MYLNEYLNQERHKDLLREARQERLAREVRQTASLTQRVGKQLLKLSITLVNPQQDECTMVEVRGQVVTICTA